MKPFYALVKLNFKTMLLSLGSFSTRRNKRKALSSTAALVFMSCLMLFIGGSYSFSLAFAFAPLGAVDIAVVMMVLLAIMMCFLFTTFSSQGILFSGKDMDIIFALPISSFKIMLAKVMAIYLENFVFTVFLVVPAIAAYIYFVGFSIVAVLYLVLSMFVIPVFPTLLGLLVTFVISFISSRVKHKNLVTTVLSLLGFGVMMALLMLLNGNMEQMLVSPDDFRTILTTYVAPIMWMRNAFVNGNLLQFLLFVATAFVPFLLTAYLLSFSYQNILTKVLSHSVKHDYKMQALSTSSAFSALLKKESKRFFGTAMYFLNAGVGPLMLLMSAVASLFFQGEIRTFLDMIPPELSSLIPAALATMAIMTCAMCTITSVSISLEGNRLWILKESPIATTTIFKAKAAVQFFYTMAIVVVSVALVFIPFSLTLVDCALILLPCFAFCLFNALFGLVANLLFPKLDVPNENIVIKQSMSVLICMFAGILLVAGILFLYFQFLFFIPPTYFLLLFTLFFFILSSALWLFLSKKGVQLFAEL